MLIVNDVNLFQALALVSDDDDINKFEWENLPLLCKPSLRKFHTNSVAKFHYHLSENRLQMRLGWFKI